MYYNRANVFAPLTQELISDDADADDDGARHASVPRPGTHHKSGAMHVRDPRLDASTGDASNKKERTAKK